MPKRASQSEARRVKLFRNGRNQAVRIPVEFELPGDAAMIRRDGNRLIIEPLRAPQSLLELLKTFDVIDEEFPDAREGLLPLRDIIL